MSDDDSDARKAGRTGAEWLTFTVSALILLAVVAMVVVQIPKENDPPLPVARITSYGEERGSSYVVAVEVTNLGDATAENIQVTVSLETDQGPQEGDQTVDFLAGGESHELEFLFEEDPSAGKLDVRVSGYGIP